MTREAAGASTTSTQSPGKRFILGGESRSLKGREETYRISLFCHRIAGITHLFVTESRENFILTNGIPASTNPHHATVHTHTHTVF